MTKSLTFKTGLDAKDNLFSEIHRCPDKRKTISSINFDDLVKVVKISEVFENEKGFIILTKIDNYTNIALVSKTHMFVNYVFNNLQEILHELHVLDEKYFIEFTNEKLCRVFSLKFCSKLKKYFNVKKISDKEFILIFKE